MTVNFNVEPYFDDYDESKGYHRILFKPGVAVQARELTQLQTILQKQIERFGRHLFKEGAMVIPGQLSIDQTVKAVKLEATALNLQTTFASANILVTGDTSGVVASVVKAVNAEGSDSPTLIVKFLKTGTNNQKTIFDNGETLSISGSASTLTTIASSAVTDSSIASIESGVYFVLGNFVSINTQSIVLDKYSSTPSYRIGLAVTEDFITEEDDSTLVDNAQGSFNENAPGAHRYKISIALDKLSLTSTLDQDFIELSRIESGIIKNLVNRTEYSVLERTLARRTYDESGNYTVRPFRIQIREHRDNNRGSWTASKANILVGDVIAYSGNSYVSLGSGTTGSTAPTHISGSVSDGSIEWFYSENPVYNQGVFSADLNGDESKLAIGLEPGKAYVQGYEIEKISTEYIPVSKARATASVTNDIIATTVGNYIKVANVFANATATLGITSFGTVNLYDSFTVTRGAVTANVVGTARVRDLTYDSGNAATTAGIFKLSLFDISMNSSKSFARNVKQIGNVAAGVAFTADISPEYIQLSGTITATASTSVVGSGTKFTTELSIGDWIYFNNPSVGRRKVVGITDDYSLTVDNSATITASIPYRIEALLYEAELQQLLFDFPYFAIKQTEDPTYTVTKAVEGTSAGGGTLSITGDTYNSSALATDYVVINRTTGAIENPTIVTTSGSISITGLTPSNNFTVILPIVKTADAKTKTPTITTLTIADSALCSQSSICLNKADVYKIDSVKMTGNTIDITDWFTLDNGQKSTHYDTAKLIKKPNYPVPSGNITIFYRYFAHGAGDYFSANSYSTVQRSDVPTFYGTNYSIRLTDVLDFRPRKDDTNTNFSGTGSSATALPRRGFQTNFDYQYYLPRNDKIVLDPNGNLYVLNGASALTAPEPNDPALGMPLYKLNLQPYTVTPKTPDVTFTYIDNKRYTMRDIGTLEKRLNQVEYYTALNLLEQETKSLTILDSEGLDRFKNGFIVDNFEGHGVGDVYASDYRCAVDMQNNQLRPFYFMNNINLVEENNTEAARITSKYQVTGDLVTLRYTHTPLITQPYASRIENVNPFSVAYFNGRFTLTPSSDEWFETARRPDLIINNDGNFDSIRASAEASGVLGTIWNAWETQWVGTPQIETIDLGLQFVDDEDARARNLTLQRETTQIGQARTGVRTSVVAKVDSRVLEDRVISVAAIPFIRSRDVMFLARGMKPNSNVYAFFDGVSVGSYVTPAAKASLTSVSGVFDYLTNAETFDTEASRNRRRKDNNPDPAFNRGDVVYIYNSGAYTEATSNGSGVVAFVENSSSGNILHLVNIQGELKAGNQVKGSISGATATLVSDVSVVAEGSTLVTNVNGDIAGVFDIPNTDSIRFRTGSRELKLTDSSTNSSVFTTRATATYTAAGVLETKQSTVVSTRSAEFVREAVTDQQVIVQSNDTIISNRNFRDDDGGDDGGGGDEPLAQTFVVDQRGGCFLTKIDLFFATKDANIPVKIEIRDVVNGYPGKRVLPFSTVFKIPQEVAVSDDASVATTFTFRSPVYLQDGAEYAVVVLTDSFNYRVWISQVGETMVGTDRIISGQPALGSLFKSQNASTWTADQLQDLKFTLYRAVFDTANTDATVSFVNEKVPSVTLARNPIKLTNNSAVVTISHPDHGFVNGSNVTISGYSTQGNVTAGEINKTHTVSNVFIDTYTIVASNAATTTTFLGGTGIVATENKAFNAMHPIIQYQTFSETAIGFNAYTTDSTLSAARSATATSIQPNRNNAFDIEKVIRADNNQLGTAADDKSLKITAVISSTNDSVSPVIDLNRNSVILVKNAIDSTVATQKNLFYAYRTVIAGNTSFSFSGNTITTTNGTVANLLASIDAGKTISIEGAGNPTNNAIVVVSRVTNIAGTANILCFYPFATESTGNAITLIVRENFIDERAPRNGSAAAKYITRQLNLKNSSKYLKVMFAATVPQQANVDVYYRTGTGSLFDTNWIQFTSPLSDIVKTQDQTFFTDVEYEIDDIPAFTTVAVKIVLRSTSTAWVPLIKDLRIIACP